MRATAAAIVASERLTLDPDRYFDPDPAVRRIARELYESVRELPLVCPHGHVDPAVLAEDRPFREPTALIIEPDHYILRMLYSQGVALEAVGIPRRDGGAETSDPRAVWQVFGEHYRLFRGTPTGAWLNHELHDVFGVRTKLTGATAGRIYDEIVEKLGSPEFRPRTLFESFGIEVLTTTDRATAELTHHRALRASGWQGRVVPGFRPDALLRIAAAEWRQELASLSAVTGTGAPITDLAGFVAALEERRLFFRSMGGTSTDHAVVEPHTARLADEVAEELFQTARCGTATMDDQRAFEAHMLMEMARMSIADGLVMQIHPGSLRDHNEAIHARFGPDMGADIPVRTEYTRNLRALLNAYGNDERLMLVLFTLDESTYARELAPLAGHYPAVRLGPPWWFHDSIEGMMRFRQQTTETAGIYNTAGFNDDTRAFCSIPARHDLARRVDANYLAGLCARHIIDAAEAREMVRALSYDLARETYRLAGGGSRDGALLAEPSPSAGAGAC